MYGDIKGLIFSIVQNNIYFGVAIFAIISLFIDKAHKAFMYTIITSIVVEGLDLLFGYGFNLFDIVHMIIIPAAITYYFINRLK